MKTAVRISRGRGPKIGNRKGYSVEIRLPPDAFADLGQVERAFNKALDYTMEAIREDGTLDSRLASRTYTQ